MAAATRHAAITLPTACSGSRGGRMTREYLFLPSQPSRPSEKKKMRKLEKRQFIAEGLSAVMASSSTPPPPPAPYPPQPPPPFPIQLPSLRSEANGGLFSFRFSFSLFLGDKRQPDTGRKASRLSFLFSQRVRTKKTKKGNAKSNTGGGGARDVTGGALPGPSTKSL